MVIVKCTMCRDPFIAKKKNAKYCAKCHREAVNKWNQDYKRKIRRRNSVKSDKPEVKTLAQWNAEARAVGMSYGQYRAMCEVENDSTRFNK